MKRLLTALASVMLIACGPSSDDDGLTLTSKFDGTWNIHEKIEHNGDGSITYHAIPWGGLVGSMRERNLPVDWSRFESINVEFAGPTSTTTQLKIGNKIRVFGKPGITTLVCYFDGQDVTQIDEVAIQTADSCELKVKRVFLTPGASVWNSTPIWEGECSFRNWENHFEIDADKFADVQEGDQLEFLYKNDRSDPTIEYWQFKTVFRGTDTPLDGNANQLNDWGCASVGGSGVFRVRLSAKDAKELRKSGLLVTGYYNIVSQANLLRRGVEVENPEPPGEQEGMER